MKFVRILILMLFSHACWANSSLWVATDDDFGIPPDDVISQFALRFDERVLQNLKVGDTFKVALSSKTTATAKLDTINNLDGRLEYIAALTDRDGALAIVQSGNSIEGSVYLTTTGINISAVSGSGGAQVKTIDNFMCGGLPTPTVQQLLRLNSEPKVEKRAVSYSTFANGLPRLASNNEPWVFYLDFDGATLRNTQWNSFYGFNTINLAPMNYDGNANTFNASEQQMIVDMYLRMVDSFSPYRVNVTTDVMIFNRTPISRRGHIVFTQTVWWLPTQRLRNSGGLAFHYSFGTYTPSLVFPHNFSARATGTHIGLAAAHEAGHMVSVES